MEQYTTENFTNMENLTLSVENKFIDPEKYNDDPEEVKLFHNLE